MRVGEIYFAPVHSSAGPRGFFGEGYWYHWLWMLRGLTFKRAGFVSKTTTLLPRLNPAKKEGNMPMTKDGLRPKEWKPECIVINFKTGNALNAVGLSGPGAAALLKTNRWQRFNEGPWWLSFMSVEVSPADQLEETRQFVELILKSGYKKWKRPFGIEYNVSCPNVGDDVSHLGEHSIQAVDILARLGVPIQVKSSADASTESIIKVVAHPACTSLNLGNTIKFGKLPHLIDWSQFSQDGKSPLEKFGGGGASGPIIRPVNCQKISELRDSHCPKPIVGCGGIDSANAVKEYVDAGTDGGIQFGSVVFNKPGKTPSIIDSAYYHFE